MLTDACAPEEDADADIGAGCEAAAFTEVVVPALTLTVPPRVEVWDEAVVPAADELTPAEAVMGAVEAELCEVTEPGAAETDVPADVEPDVPETETVALLVPVVSLAEVVPTATFFVVALALDAPLLPAETCTVVVPEETAAVAVAEVAEVVTFVAVETADVVVFGVVETVTDDVDVVAETLAVTGDFAVALAPVAFSETLLVGDFAPEVMPLVKPVALEAKA